MRNEVLFKTLAPARPVFHRSGEWWEELRRDGVVVVCNTIVYAGTDRQIGNNGGYPLPERLLAPCGIDVARRAPIIERRSSPGGTEVLNSTRMVVQGIEVPERHARKFGVPCKRCYPSISNEEGACN